MSSGLELAQATLLHPAELSERELTATLDSLLSHDVDAADLYFQYRRSRAWTLEDGIVKEGSQSIQQGVGVRAMSGEKTGLNP